MVFLTPIIDLIGVSYLLMLCLLKKIYLLILSKFSAMNIFVYLSTLALHLYVIIDAFSNIKERHGVFRVILAFIPPVIGPIIYLLTQPKTDRLHRRRSYMKRRFS